MIFTKRFLTVVTIGLIFCKVSSAQEEMHEQKISLDDKADAHVHGSHAECPLPKSVMDVIRCAQEVHPDVQRAKLTLAQVKGLSGIAGQLKNPELDVESASGSINGENQSESKIAILVPLEIGGNRSARRLEAESQANKSAAELFEIQSNVVIKTAKRIHRLRQLEQEKSLLQEAVDTFSQVVSQQKSRPGLSPEQRVSLSVFKMALAEAKIRQSELFEEEKSLGHYFHISTGHSLNELKQALPEPPRSWPEIGPASNSRQSPGMMRSKAELDFALAQLKTAQAESWPELKIGPMVQQIEEGSNSGSIFGFQLSMELPIFSLNFGSRNFARLGEVKANKGIELTQVEESHEREELLQVYQRTIQTLKEAPTPEELEKDHKQHEGFAKRGLISASLVIESHRQIEELTRSRHEQELKALESLWQIYKFDGQILKETL